MTIQCPATRPAGKTFTISEDLPVEVQDPGNVRIGAGVHLCWITWEILHYLPGLIRFLPDSSC